MAAGFSQKKAAEQLGTYPTRLLWQRDNPLYIGLVYQGRQNVLALSDRSYVALWSLAEDPAIDWIYPGRHEPLIDADTWDRMQARLASRTPRARQSDRLALSGQLRCECGRALRIHHNQGTRAPSLRCDICGWERSYPYIEGVIVAALGHVAHSAEYEQAVEEELRRRRPDDTEERLEAMGRERAAVAGRLDRAIDAMLDAPEVSAALRTKAAALKEDLDRLDREAALLKAAIRGRTVSDWREVKRDLLTLDLEAAWRVAGVSEQRALITGVFSRIVAGPEVVTFHVHGQPFPIQADWSAVVKVAGPGLEPGTP